MITYISKQRTRKPFRAIVLYVLWSFVATLVAPAGYAQTVAPEGLFHPWGGTGLNLPPPGTMVTVSPVFHPALLRGIKIHPQNPLEFDFIVDGGNSNLKEPELKEESRRLVKYFLAGLTIPEKDLWVNLSPYEDDRIIPEGFGATEMGRDLLAQDYILKQLTASLIYPEDDLGRKFWTRVKAMARNRYGVADIPLNGFNKVWIVPAKAIIYEKNDTAFVVESRLKVMMEEDYVAREANSSFVVSIPSSVERRNTDDGIRNTSSEILKEIVLPEIEKEVNEGKNFAQLRQVYHSLILAAWFKQALKGSLLGKVYVDHEKIEGVDVEDREIKTKIYQQYLEAYKKGVYNYIKEDYDPATQQLIPRKYFSGGTEMFIDPVLQRTSSLGDLAMVTSPGAVEKAVNGGSFTNVNVVLDQAGRSAETADPAMAGDSIRKLKRTLLLMLLTAVMSNGDSLVSAAEIQWETKDNGAPQLTALVKPSDESVEVIVRELADLKHIALSEKEIQQLAEKLLQDNRVIIEDGRLQPGQVLDLTNVEDLLDSIDLINNSDVIAVQSVTVNGREIVVHFIDIEDHPLFSHLVEIVLGDNIFLNLNGFQEQVKIVRRDSDVDAQDDDILRESAVLLKELFNDKSDEYIFMSYLKQMVFHALAHTATIGLIDEGLNEEKMSVLLEDHYIPERFIHGSKVEMAGLLAQLRMSSDPKSFLNFINALSVAIPSSYSPGGHYVYVSRIITEALFDRLGYRDYVEKQEVDPSRQDTVDSPRKAFTIKYDAGVFFEYRYHSYFIGFARSLTDEEIHEAAQEMYEKLYGVMPLVELVTIPQEVVDFYRAKYTQDPEDNGTANYRKRNNVKAVASSADAAMSAKPSGDDLARSRHPEDGGANEEARLGPSDFGPRDVETSPGFSPDPVAEPEPAGSWESATTLESVAASGSRAAGGGIMIGEDIGNYEILDMLGWGRYSDVYKVRKMGDPDKKIFALKKYRLEGLSFNGREFIEAEREFYRRVARSRDLVDQTYLPYAVAEDEDYTVIPYYEGQTLAQYLENQDFSVQEKVKLAQAVGAEVGGALHRLHTHYDSVHLDIKPNNILVRKVNGRYIVRVIDFTLIRDIGSSFTEGFLGTLKYSSPEQIQRDTFSENTDIYALGLVMYKILTEMDAFELEDPRDIEINAYRALRVAAMQEPISHLEENSVVLPAGLKKILRRMLAFDPGDRYPTAREFMDDLARYASETRADSADSVSSDARDLAMAGKGGQFGPGAVKISLGSPSPAAEPGRVPKSTPSEGWIGAGEHIGDYEILGGLGHGSYSAVVYKVRKTGDAAGRVLAFKRYSLGNMSYASRQFIKFEKEFYRRVKASADPLDRRYLPYAIEEGEDYVVIPYFAGTTLKQYLDDNPDLSFEDRVEITLAVGTEVGEALRRLHKYYGSVHLDINPRNILIHKTNGRYVVRVIDFTFVRDIGSSFAQGVLGTLEYMSPEQIRKGLFLEATDVYGLGLVLSKILIGTNTFQFGDVRDMSMSEHLAVRLAAMQEPIPYLSEDSTALPAGLKKILRRMLAFDPADRYPTAREFMDDLARYASEVRGAASSAIESIDSDAQDSAMVGKIQIFTKFTYAGRNREIIDVLKSPLFWKATGLNLRLGKHIAINIGIGAKPYDTIQLANTLREINPDVTIYGTEVPDNAPVAHIRSVLLLENFRQDIAKELRVSLDEVVDLVLVVNQKRQVVEAQVGFEKKEYDQTFYMTFAVAPEADYVMQANKISVTYKREDFFKKFIKFLGDSNLQAVIAEGVTQDKGDLSIRFNPMDIELSEVGALFVPTENPAADGIKNASIIMANYATMYMSRLKRHLYRNMLKESLQQGGVLVETISDNSERYNEVNFYAKVDNNLVSIGRLSSSGLEEGASLFERKINPLIANSLFQRNMRSRRKFIHEFDMSVMASDLELSSRRYLFDRSLPALRKLQVDIQISDQEFLEKARKVIARLAAEIDVDGSIEQGWSDGFDAADLAMVAQELTQTQQASLGEISREVENMPAKDLTLNLAFEKVKQLNDDPTSVYHGRLAEDNDISEMIGHLYRHGHNDAAYKLHLAFEAALVPAEFNEKHVKAMGKRVGRLMNAAGLSAAALAEILQMTPGTLRKLIRGDAKDPLLETILKIANHFKVSVFFLMIGRKDPVPFRSYRLDAVSGHFTAYFNELISRRGLTAGKLTKFIPGAKALEAGAVPRTINFVRSARILGALIDEFLPKEDQSEDPDHSLAEGDAAMAGDKKPRVVRNAPQGVSDQRLAATEAATQEERLIKNFEEVLITKLVVLQSYTRRKPSRGSEEEKFREYYRKRKQLEWELISFIIDNLEGIDGGIGFENMASSKAQEWLKALISIKRFIYYINERGFVYASEDGAEQVLRVKAYEVFLDEDMLIDKKKKEVYGVLGKVNQYTKDIFRADYYHGTISFVLASVLEHGLINYHEAEEREIEQALWAAEIGGGQLATRGVVSLAKYFINWSAQAGMRSFRGYPIVFGVSKVTLEEDGNSEGWSTDRIEEVQVNHVRPDHVTHVYVPQVKMQEVRKILEDRGIDWIKVVNMNTRYGFVGSVIDDDELEAGASTSAALSKDDLEQVGLDVTDQAMAVRQNLSDFGGGNDERRTGDPAMAGGENQDLVDLILATAIMFHGGPLAIIDDGDSVNGDVNILTGEIGSENVVLTKLVNKWDKMATLLGQFMRINFFVYTFNNMVSIQQGLRGPLVIAEARKYVSAIKQAYGEGDLKSWSKLAKKEYLQWLADSERVLAEIENLSGNTRFFRKSQDKKAENARKDIYRFAAHYRVIVRVLRGFLSDEMPSDLLDDVADIDDLIAWLAEQEWLSKGKNYPVRVIDGGHDITLKTHDGMLKLAIERIISNAFHAIERREGELPPEDRIVTVTENLVEDQNGQAVAQIIVRNPGRIDPILLEVDEASGQLKVFVLDFDREKFEMGVGLRLAVRMVEKLGGTVKVRNLDGQVEFVVELPLLEGGQSNVLPILSSGRDQKGRRARSLDNGEQQLGAVNDRAMIAGEGAVPVSRFARDGMSIETLAASKISRSDAFSELGGKVGETSANLKPKDVGGIGLQATDATLEIERQGEGITLPVDLTDFENADFTGFIPIIINLTPIHNLPFLLGIAPEDIKNMELSRN